MNDVQETEKPHTRPLVVQRMRLQLMAILERSGIATAREDQPSRMEAARELIEDGLAIEKGFGPLPATYGRGKKPARPKNTLTIIRNAAAVGTREWQIAAGRLDPGRQTTRLPGEGGANLLGIETASPEFEALCDALMSRLLPRILEALKPPASRDLTSDETVLAAIDGRTGFTMDQVLAWLGWPLDRPTLRQQIGATLTRLGYGRSRHKDQFGELRRVYIAPGAVPRSEAVESFAGRLAAVLEDFRSVTQDEVAKLMQIEIDHGMSVKIGRAMPRIGWRKRIHLANSADRYVSYERVR